MERFEKLLVFVETPTALIDSRSEGALFLLRFLKIDLGDLDPSLFRLVVCQSIHPLFLFKEAACLAQRAALEGRFLLF